MALPNPNNDHNINDLVATAVELLSSIVTNKQQQEEQDQTTMRSLVPKASGTIRICRKDHTPAPVEVTRVENYVCDVCGRSFGSHQALGGHRASHNKFKMSIINTNDVDSVPKPKPKRRKRARASSGPGSGNGDDGDGNNKQAKVGGNMTRQGCGFDLNELPKDDHEDGHDQDRNDGFSVSLFG